MMNIISNLRSAITLFLVFTLLLGVAYPLLVTAIGQILFYDKANGSLIVDNDKAIGSRLLGQKFAQDKYFWGRLSATNYDTTESVGTNLSPANPKLLENLNARVEALKKSDPTNVAKIPVDLVTASGSALDPHISLIAAEYQIARIAKARSMKPEDVQAIITDHIDTESQFFGAPYVNVLELNLALDKNLYKTK